MSSFLTEGELDLSCCYLCDQTLFFFMTATVYVFTLRLPSVLDNLMMDVFLFFLSFNANVSTAFVQISQIM